MCVTLLLTDSLLKVLIATSQLVSKFFEPKFAIARTKCESVIVGCFAPMIAAELHQELDKVNFVSLTIDTSKRKGQGRRKAGLCLLLIHFIDITALVCNIFSRWATRKI